MRPRHIEIQLLGDQHGTVLPFVERECSIQRRHQKVVEESPSLGRSPRSCADGWPAAAAAVARRVGYTNAGTIEFLLDETGEFFFLEMNTRLQVEHPITELVTGIDLVHWQIRIARGERLDLDPGAHADAGRPRHRVPHLRRGSGPRLPAVAGPRHGACARRRAPASAATTAGRWPGVEVPVFYDPLIAKLATWAETRPMAIARMARALDEYDVRGIKTTIPFFRWLLADSRTSRPAASTRRSSTTRSPRGTGGRSSRCRRTPSDIAAAAAALQAFTRKAPRPAAAGRAREPLAAGRANRRRCGRPTASPGDHDAAADRSERPASGRSTSNGKTGSTASSSTASSAWSTPPPSTRPPSR